LFSPTVYFLSPTVYLLSLKSSNKISKGKIVSVRIWSCVFLELLGPCLPSTSHTTNYAV
jgi:hypothetical protein